MMTLEQRKHESEYLAAKKRYENAYIAKSKYKKDLYEIQNKKTQVINKINELRSERKRVKRVYEELSNVRGNDSDVNDGIVATQKHLSEASVHFKAIGTSSLGDQKNLSDIFADKEKKTKTSLNTAFGNIKKMEQAFENDILNLDIKIKKLECELYEFKSKMAKYTVLIEENSKTMKNAAIDMAYHKKRMMY